MKKHDLLILIIVFIFIVFSLLGIVIYDSLSSYSTVLKANWNIEIPENLMKEIYSADEGARFHGDGIRYHIFSYEEDA